MTSLVSYNIEELSSILPHGHPFIMIDRAYVDKEERVCYGVKAFTNTEYYFPGHFPDMKVVPGVLIVEALAQSAFILAYSSYQYPKKTPVLFTSLDKVKFRKATRPGYIGLFKVVLERAPKENSSVRIFKFSATGYIADGNINENTIKDFNFQSKDVSITASFTAHIL